MRIFFCELYKLLSKKIFIICLVVALCINAFTLIYSSAENYNDRTKHNNIEYYNSLIKNCNSSKKASEYLKKELDIINERLTENSTDKDALVEKMTLLNDLISQQNYINRYDDFINNMQIRADNQLSFSIFAEPDSFAYNNIQQTPLDFQHLKGVELYAGNNTFAENATQFQITDYLMIVLVALTCILLFYTERENGLYPLVRSTKNGRTSTIVAKLFAVIAVTVVTTILFYLSNILITGIYFGFGDMSRYIQSIGIFMNCSIKISIFEYLILWILGKTLTLCAFSLLFSFCFTAVKASAKIYGIIVVFLAVEITANLFIEGASAFSFFKYVNIVYFLSNNNLFGEYLNVNIFSNPVNIIMVWTVVATTLALVGFFGSVTVYPINAYGYTYCEKKDAGKKANTYFAYYDISGKLRECGIVSKNFVYNGQVGLNKKTPSPNTDIFDYYAGAMTVSEVVYPNQTYYHWSSENTDYELRLGIYKR